MYSLISQHAHEFVNPTFKDCALILQGTQRHPIFLPQSRDKLHQILPFFAYGSIETSMYVMHEEFQHESAFLALTHDGAADLEFIYEGVG